MGPQVCNVILRPRLGAPGWAQGRKSACNEPPPSACNEPPPIPLIGAALPSLVSSAPTPVIPAGAKRRTGRKVPPCGHVPGTPKCRLAARPRNLERSGRVSGVQRKDFARSALPSCLKAITSRCAALLYAGSLTRFRCAAPFRERAASGTLGRCGLAHPVSPASSTSTRHPGRSAAESRDLHAIRRGGRSRVGARDDGGSATGRPRERAGTVEL